MTKDYNREFAVYLNEIQSNKVKNFNEEISRIATNSIVFISVFYLFCFTSEMRFSLIALLCLLWLAKFPMDCNISMIFKTWQTNTRLSQSRTKQTGLFMKLSNHLPKKIISNDKTLLVLLQNLLSF